MQLLLLDKEHQHLHPNTSVRLHFYHIPSKHLTHPNIVLTAPTNVLYSWASRSHGLCVKGCTIAQLLQQQQMMQCNTQDVQCMHNPNSNRGPCVVPAHEAAATIT